jgi:hypothetical protein
VSLDSLVEWYLGQHLDHIDFVAQWTRWEPVCAHDAWMEVQQRLHCRVGRGRKEGGGSISVLLWRT